MVGVLWSPDNYSSGALVLPREERKYSLAKKATLSEGRQCEKNSCLTSRWSGLEKHGERNDRVKAGREDGWVA